MLPTGVINHNNGNPSGNGNRIGIQLEWEQYSNLGMEMEWEGVGTNVDGNGNDPYSHGEKFPRVVYHCRPALGGRPILCTVALYKYFSLRISECDGDGNDPMGISWNGNKTYTWVWEGMEIYFMEMGAVEM